MRNITVAAIQMSVPETPEKSIAKAEKLVRQAAAGGANVILLPELFENWYFCQERRYDSYKLASTADENPAVRHFRKVAAELGVVMPISFYEQDGNVLYNSIAMIDTEFTARRISPTTTSTRRNSTSPRVELASGYGTHASAR